MIIIYILLINIIYGAENCPGCGSGSACLNQCQRFGVSCNTPGSGSDVSWDACKTAQDAANNNNLCAVRRDGSGKTCNLCAKELCKLEHDGDNGETCPNCDSVVDCKDECTKLGPWSCSLVPKISGDVIAQSWSICKGICEQNNNMCAVRDLDKNCYCCSKDICNAPSTDNTAGEQCPNCVDPDDCIAECKASNKGNDDVIEYLEDVIGFPSGMAQCYRLPPINVNIRVPSYTIYNNKKTPNVDIDQDVYPAEYSWSTCKAAVDEINIALGNNNDACAVRKDNGKCYVCAKAVCRFDICAYVGDPPLPFPCDDYVGVKCGVDCPAFPAKINPIYNNLLSYEYPNNYYIIFMVIISIIIIWSFINIICCIYNLKSNNNKGRYSKVVIDSTDFEEEENQPINVQ